jgi:hypothetical protein
MSYYFYENWVAEGHKARIHFGSCSFCNQGTGIHPGAGTKNGGWSDSYSSIKDAMAAAKKTGGKVSKCKFCRPT